MKISTRIASGYTLLIALIVAVFTYQVVLVHRMHSITQNLGEVNFGAALTSLELWRDLEQMDEFTQKLVITGGDPGYAEQLESMRQGFSQSLRQLAELPLSPDEQAPVDAMTLLWQEASQGWAQIDSALGARSSQQAQQALDEEIVTLRRLQVESQELIRASRTAIASQVEISEQAAERAQQISLLTALLAFLVSVLVSVWIVRSISRPLKRLTAGTRAVAQGQFDYRLEAEGSDELAGLARDFNRMILRLTELDQMKKDFVSHASHELKTPLASVQETIRLLLDEIPGQLNAQQRRLLELNLQSASRLSALIANLLDLSRMEAGVMEYTMERRDLSALIRSAVAEFELPLADRNLRLETVLPEEPFWTQCDGGRLIQVIGNLLGNALKFSPAGSTLRLSLRHDFALPSSLPGSWRVRLAAVARDTGYAVITLTDQGPGIPADERTNIFDRFHQVRRDGKRPGQGTGLGLAISRTIAEAHSGALWVEDNPEGGSVFFLLLPALDKVPQPISRASAPI